jgi:DNA-binding beta-propeller fold protein YncE
MGLHPGPSRHFVAVGLRAVGVLLATLGPGCGDGDPPSPGADDRVYVCAQDQGRVDVLDAETLATIAVVPMGAARAPHNLIRTPGGQILVTNAHATGELADELVAIDPVTNTITGRVALEGGAFVAHVVVAPDGQVAYVSAWGGNLIYRVDVATMTRLADIPMTALRRPHGLRLSADGRRLYSANTDAGSVSEIDTVSGQVVREFPLPGSAVQVAVGDGAVFATVRSPAAVARIDLASAEVTIWPLPNGAKEPAQIVITPDHARLLVAEQGNKDLEGNLLDVLDAATGAVIAQVEVGLGAHGIALAPSGRVAYVTAIFEGVVAAVDLDTMTVRRRGNVGRGPNGIEIWGPKPP